MRRMVYLCIIIDEVNEVAEVIASLEVIEVKGVNDDTQSRERHQHDKRR